MAYAILRARKIKSWPAIGAAARHNDRRSAPANADPTRGVQMLVGTGDVEAEARTRLLAVGIDPTRLRKDGVIAIEAIVTASPGYFRPGRDASAGVWDADRLAAWLDAALRFLAAEWGDRIVSVVLHTDEATPHLHVVWLPIDDTPRKRGPVVRLNAGRWLDGRAKLIELQDRYARAMANIGLERGVRGSRAHHKTVTRLYGALQANAKAAEHLARLAALKLGQAELSRRRALDHEQRSRRLFEQAEVIYRHAVELLPSLARSILAAPIHKLGAMLQVPVAARARRNQLVHDRLELE